MRVEVLLIESSAAVGAGERVVNYCVYSRESRRYVCHQRRSEGVRCVYKCVRSRHFIDVGIGEEKRVRVC